MPCSCFPALPAALACGFLPVCAFVVLLLCVSALSAFPLFFLPSACVYFSFSACSCFCFCFSAFPLVCFFDFSRCAFTLRSYAPPLFCLSASLFFPTYYYDDDYYYHATTTAIAAAATTTTTTTITTSTTTTTTTIRFFLISTSTLCWEAKPAVWEQVFANLASLASLAILPILHHLHRLQHLHHLHRQD